jgi:hypothetical protein
VLLLNVSVLPWLLPGCSDAVPHRKGNASGGPPRRRHLVPTPLTTPVSSAHSQEHSHRLGGLVDAVADEVEELMMGSTSGGGESPGGAVLRETSCSGLKEWLTVIWEVAGAVKRESGGGGEGKVTTDFLPCTTPLLSL